MRLEQWLPKQCMFSIALGINAKRFLAEVASLRRAATRTPETKIRKLSTQLDLNPQLPFSSVFQPFYTSFICIRSLQLLQFDIYTLHYVGFFAAVPMSGTDRPTGRASTTST